ncbi:MAG: TIGR04133 family radical SAM/SPASM protein [Bacteroidaceae bacterium]|nr:TIGR04133 family radical SAM/SPASM protein [Bacteroidaceae bacterium]
MSELSLIQRISLEMHRSMYLKAAKEHPLREVFWECTLKCNLRCRHCGSDCKAESKTPDMPAADFLKVLDNISSHTDPHKVMIVITGGEPLMRPDLEACGREIYRKGFPWGMVTNGYALTPERFERLKTAGLRSVTISLDGLMESHDWMRGKKGSFEKASAAIRMVTQSGLVNDVVTCVNKRNICQLSTIRSYLIGCGVSDWRIFTVFPQGRAKNDPDMNLSAADIRNVMEFIRETRKQGIINCSFACEGFLGKYEGVVRDRFFTCNAGIFTASVLADGSISACPSIRADYHQGNIYKDDFWSVWQDRYNLYRDRSWMCKDECADCRYFRYCHGNGMHLRDSEGKLIHCLLNSTKEAETAKANLGL